jgi:hypothetical protein
LWPLIGALLRRRPDGRVFVQVSGALTSAHAVHDVREERVHVLADSDGGNDLQEEKGEVSGRG